MLTIPSSVQTAIISAILALINTLGLETPTGDSSTSHSAISNTWNKAFPRGLHPVIGHQNKI